MPETNIPRFKIIRCHTDGKIIRRFDRSKYVGWHVPASDILSAIRHHYHLHHPGKFRVQIKKAVKTRRSRKG